MSVPSAAEATLATEVLDLATALDGLAGLVLGDVTLGALLTVVAGFAATAIPGADGAGVTMLHKARREHDRRLRDVRARHRHHPVRTR